jgi:6-phosphogluconolactonase
MTSPSIHTPDAPAELVAAWLEDAAARTIAVPGGSVTELFPRLARARLDWPRVHLFWVDERAVPPTHAESNFGAARALIATGAQVHRMEAEREDADRAAADYEGALRAAAPDGLDFVLLGVGPDGHVASLFPGHALLAAREKWVAVVDDAPKPPPRRMTLTLPVLLAARTVVVMALSAGKAGLVRGALTDPTSMLPVALVMRGNHDVRLVLPA